MLRADVFCPAGDGPHPVILSHGPYAKGLAFQEGYAEQWKALVTEHPEVLRGSTGDYQNWEVVDPERWVPDGYACVRVDSRGAGRSPGRLDPLGLREVEDLYRCIEWAGTAPWSNGKVGLLGISYYAINQWQVASRKPPHLAAICPWEGAADWYRDMTYHGGILCTFFANWFEQQVLTVQHGLGERGPHSAVTGEPVAGPETLSDAELVANRADFAGEIRAHPVLDAYHAARSPDFARIEVPLLSAANWGGQGLHSRGNFEGFTRAASSQKWLEVHGREHWTEFYTDYGVELQNRFFARFLKGERGSWDHQPPVRLQVRTLNGFVQRDEQEWPLARTRWTKLYLDPRRSSLRSQPLRAAATVAFEAPAGGATFAGPPLAEETELTGPLAAKLFLSSSTEDADLVLVLRLFDPDGAEVVFQGAIDPRTPPAQGWLRASHRRLDVELSTPERPYHDHRAPEPLTPGTVYELDVEIWPTSIVIPAGYRLALSVRGSDYETSAPGAGARLTMFKNELKGCGPFLHDDPHDRTAPRREGTRTLHAGPTRQAYLLLPVVPPR